MELSRQGAHLIASFEGFVPTPYNDAAGNATIGYGHLIHYGPVTEQDRTQLGIWTVDYALTELARDCSSAVQAVNAAIKVRLAIIPARRQARFDACVSLAFNIGAAGFAGSSLAREINRKGAPRDWYPLGPYWLEWDHAGGIVLPGLLNRRRREFALFASGVYPAV